MFRSHTHAEIAAKLGRTELAVRNLCWKRGWRKAVEGWSDAEIAILREAYAAAGEHGPVHLAALASRLGRSQANVSRKAREAGLTSYQRSRPDAAVEAMSKRATEWHSSHEHPRGALGMCHTPEARGKISAANRALWADQGSAHNSDARNQRLSDSLHARHMRVGPTPGYSRAASGRRRDLDGRYFRSSWEANYARYLNWLAGRRIIQSWEYEPRVFEFTAIRRGTRSYTPDFRVVFPDGHHEWHEVKGWMDPKSVTRIARFAKYYPNEHLVIIGKPFFQALVRQGVPAMLPFWERRPAKANPRLCVVVERVGV